MREKASKPDPARVIGELKDFQRKSVHYVFKRLYKDKDNVKRFLIADEVGLGKTMVARGVTAKAVDFLWEKRKRIDIVYVCSNSDIAKQNVNRLNITQDKQFSLASRLTLLPISVHSLKENKLNFVAFTPGTSFDLRSSTGLYKERALLYHLLHDIWKLGSATGPINLFQCGSGRDYWRRYLREFPRIEDIDKQAFKDFRKSLRTHIRETEKGDEDLRKRFMKLSKQFSYARKKYPVKLRVERNKLVGELRHLLAISCVQSLEPDLVILDEFQRFKHLLNGTDKMSELAQEVFNYIDAKVILLSATPYKMYTLSTEKDDSHYEDFIRTIGFLLDSEQKAEKFRAILNDYRNELYQLNRTDFKSGDLSLYKKRIERTLRKVMIRTERGQSQESSEDLVVDKMENNVDKIRVKDLTSFVEIDGISKALDAGGHLEYWKSAPYTLNLMDDYAIKRKLKDMLGEGRAPSILAKAVREDSDSLLSWKEIEEYKEIGGSNAKLRSLIKRYVQDQADLLWIPASLPYYEPRGVYKDKKATKNLVFSSWQVVPKAISMLCSYEAERQIMSKFDSEISYTEARKKIKPMLRFAYTQEDEKRRAMGMPIFLLIYPCFTLAREIDPLVIASNMAINGKIPEYREIENVVTHRIKSLIETIPKKYVSEERPVDERWYWAALAHFDRQTSPEILNTWFSKTDKDSWRNMILSRTDSEHDTNYAEHVDKFIGFFGDPQPLGKFPDDLVEVLTKTALASPGIVTLRSLYRLWSRIEAEEVPNVLAAAARIALGFRGLYNNPESIALIKRINPPMKPYWRCCIEYGLDGNIQAVIDEYTHVLREYLGLINATPLYAAEQLAEAFYDSITIRTSALAFDSFSFEDGNVKTDRHRLRCHFALRFGEAKDHETSESIREDHVRNAFNSPFKPFILATTSLGQEGLDFHQYCHSIYHWNLPSNPVDLEQREGRIFRYKSHFIRRNIATEYGLKSEGLKIEKHSDIWAELFKQAKEERLPMLNDLNPYWVYNRGAGYTIERNVPVYPLSRDIKHFKDLKRSLAAYRMVFGQPRQEDLLDYLKSQLDDDQIEEVLKYRIDLSP